MIANYLQILWSIILEIVFLGSYPHWLSLIGACLILFNAGIAVYKAARAKPDQGKESESTATSGNKEKKGKYIKLDAPDEDEEDDNTVDSENEESIQMDQLSKQKE